LPGCFQKQPGILPFWAVQHMKKRCCEALRAARLRLFGRFFLRSGPEQPPPVRMENTL